MCRLFATLANQPTKVDCSLIRAQNELMKQKADSWGIVCYDEQERWRIPSTIKHHAAGRGLHFSGTVAETYSRAMVSHVRMGTVGHHSTLNAQPFTYDDWTFAHNGTIPCFETICATLEANVGERYLNCRLGTSDSELFFLWLLYQLEANGVNSETIPDQPEAARKTLANAIAALAQNCRSAAPQTTAKLSFVLTNGHCMFACRWNETMYMLVRDGLYRCRICGTPHVRQGSAVNYRAVLIASEPMTDEHWESLPNHSLVSVSAGLECVVEPVPHNGWERVNS